MSRECFALTNAAARIWHHLFHQGDKPILVAQWRLPRAGTRQLAGALFHPQLGGSEGSAVRTVPISQDHLHRFQIILRFRPGNGECLGISVIPPMPMEVLRTVGSKSELLPDENKLYRSCVATPGSSCLSTL